MDLLNEHMDSDERASDCDDNISQIVDKDLLKKNDSQTDSKSGR